jgi:hypothetical protein
VLDSSSTVTVRLLMGPAMTDEAARRERMMEVRIVEDEKAERKGGRVRESEKAG